MLAYLSFLAFTEEVSSSGLSSDLSSILDANKLLGKALQDENPGLLIHSYRSGEELGAFVWSDAAWANRPKEGSTGGLLACMAPLRLRAGDETGLGYMHWSSGKLRRVELSAFGASSTVCRQR